MEVAGVQSRRQVTRALTLSRAAATVEPEILALARSPLAARRLPSAAELAPDEEVERFTGVLLTMMETSGYSDFGPGPATVEKTRRLVRRLALRMGDVNLWTGILRQALWRMRRAASSEAPKD